MLYGKCVVRGVASFAIATIGACSDSAPHQVTVRTAVDPSFVAVTTDDGQTWSHPDPVGVRTYAFEADDAFQFTAVLELSNGSHWAQQLNARYADGDSWTLSDGSTSGAANDASEAPPSMTGGLGDCLSFSQNPGAPVSGTLLQTGVVSFAGECMVNNSGTAMPFHFDGAPGPHDLIARSPSDSAAPRLVVSRNIASTSAVDLGNIDLDTGIALAPLTFTLDGVDGSAPVTVTSVLATRTDTAEISALDYNNASQVHAFVAPSAALSATDQQAVEIHSSRAGDLDQAARVQVGDATATHVAMLGAPRVLVTSGVAALSQPLDAKVTTVDLSLLLITQQPGTTNLQQVTWTKGWLDVHPDAALSFNGAIDGYDPAWALDTSAPHTWRFDVRNDAPEATFSTSVAGTIQ